MTDPILLTIGYDDDGEPIEVECPTRKEVCPKCRGEGTHIHQAFIDEAFTREDAERDGLDFYEEIDAMQAGRYDVPCNRCHGLRVVDVPDRDALTPEEREALAEHEEDERQFEAQCRAERLYGC
jgi:hypothetical protein